MTHSALDLDALRNGGIVLAVPWGCGHELRIASCIGCAGRRKFSVRVFYLDAARGWLPSRLGVSRHLSASEVRRLAAALVAVGDAASAKTLSARKARA